MPKSKITEELKSQIMEMRKSMTLQNISAQVGLSRETVRRVSGNIYLSGPRADIGLIAVLRRKEAAILLPGCFNVYDEENWVW